MWGNSLESTRKGSCKMVKVWEFQVFLLQFLSPSPSSLCSLLPCLPLISEWRLNTCTLIGVVGSSRTLHNLLHLINLSPFFLSRRTIGTSTSMVLQLLMQFRLFPPPHRWRNGVSAGKGETSPYLHYRRWESSVSSSTPAVLLLHSSSWPSISLHPIVPPVQSNTAAKYSHGLLR